MWGGKIFQELYNHGGGGMIREIGMRNVNWINDSERGRLALYSGHDNGH
jgi:hypothetical protein